MRIEDHYGAPAYCALCDHPCSVGPLCNACMADDDEEEDDGPADDSWYQSALERAAGPPRNTL
jgi:hypothetical protein